MTHSENGTGNRRVGRRPSALTEAGAGQGGGASYHVAASFSRKAQNAPPELPDEPTPKTRLKRARQCSHAPGMMVGVFAMATARSSARRLMAWNASLASY